MIYDSIAKLISYGLDKDLIDPLDKTFCTNRILEALELEDYEEPGEQIECESLAQTLNELTDYAVEKGLCEDSIVFRDLFDTKLMGLITPPPSSVNRLFKSDYDVSPKLATENFYRLSGDTNYIRRDRIAKDVKWKTSTEYGELDITINLSKPEKDPKAIAAAKNAPQSGYPKCQLCRECEGYAGRVNYPARQNHRIIAIDILGEPWGFQYSPYVYYNEHCIVFNKKHTPMVIDKSAFDKLFDFERHFPHYFVGSNADLPIVGGSILTHEHFQGGHYTFAMERAEIETKLSFKGYEDVDAGIVKWPMSVIRLSSESSSRLSSLADKILTCWRSYSDPNAFIYAETDGVPHNTITPIARTREIDGKRCYELDLVLRNNITTPEHPLGVYHPHAELHHIKKENIGLIEVMGLAVLPSRLKSEMEQLSEVLINDDDPSKYEALEKHAKWAEQIKAKYAQIDSHNVMDILHVEIGLVFMQVLEDAGVYKRDDEGKNAFLRFVKHVNEGA
ncbi:MAG: UDP-glucose--hexose-1-phosphate uridylyltransferase [Ruminococcus sp.]|nr:UDP-glucose--hexose-1-phosphate uridylyltransferase [Ruminococcus sp.]